MLKLKNRPSNSPKWEDVKAGDFIVMDYRAAEEPQLCVVYPNPERSNALSVRSLTEIGLHWSDISDWSDNCSNALIEICKKGTEFIIA